MAEVDMMPFTSAQKTVVNGGLLGSQCWVPELEYIEGHGDGFLLLHKADRHLARALGMNMNKSAPMDDVTVFSWLAQKRDDQVDEFMARALKADDPMAQQDAVDIPGVGRAKLFQECKVPGVIAIAIDELINPMGKRIDATSLHVVSTPRRGVSPCVKASNEFLNWLACVVGIEFQINPVGRCPKASDYWSTMTLPSLPAPIKYRKRGASLSICQTYKDINGKPKTHQEHVTNKRLKIDVVDALVSESIVRMAQFIEDLHVDQ